MIRCPECTKAYKVFLDDDISLLINKDMNRVTIVHEPLPLEPLDLLACIQQMDSCASLGVAFDDLNTGMEDLDEVTCGFCGHIDSMENFIDAYENPMDYFDAENLCACGDEVWLDQNEYTRRYEYVCDSCGWVKPKVSVSGSGNADAL